jgi:hypothetical protein
MHPPLCDVVVLMVGQERYKEVMEALVLMVGQER